jgi:hypothetical protein
VDPFSQWSRGGAGDPTAGIESAVLVVNELSPRLDKDVLFPGFIRPGRRAPLTKSHRFVYFISTNRREDRHLPGVAANCWSPGEKNKK